MDKKELKNEVIRLLINAVTARSSFLKSIDERLLKYYNGLLMDSGLDPNQLDYHNLYELLGALRLLRLMRTYTMNIEKVQQVIRLREGEWERNEQGIWKHLRGGLRNPGDMGDTYYRWEPFQVFIWTAIYGPMAWIDTGVEAGTRDMRDTERARNGYIEDLRRLCTDFTYFGPRKTDKTGLSAYNNFLFFMLEDANAEIYCAANSAAQSALLYKRSQALIRQMDPNERRIRFTSSVTNWKEGQPRQARMEALSAGGKTKDGLFAQLCCADEFGSAGYVAGKSDMGNLVNVVLSSMGPRREPMLFTSTTAGTIDNGPFIDKLRAMKIELEKEVAYAKGEATPTLETDRWMCILFEPDEWERDEDVLFTSRSVRRKVNPMLGISVQHAFYDQAIAESRLDPLKKLETKTKLFNIYSSDAVKEWIQPDQIRVLQINRRIDDCNMDAGWDVYAAFDFSHGDDFDAVSYLAYNINTGEYFTDCDAWVNEDAFESSPYHELYVKWEAEGWLHKSPGKTVQPELPIARIMELDAKNIRFIAFGYDAYQSKEPILLLKEWLKNELGITRPDTLVVPVSQTNGAYNPAVQKLDYCIDGVVDLKFSNSPLWPFEFANCLLEEDERYGNKKPRKRSANAKVDNVQCLCSCFILEESYDSILSKQSKSK